MGRGLGALLILIMPIYLIAAAAMANGQSTKIDWQGYTWYVKSTPSEGPGPCRWSPKQVWVDEQGFLHMRISKVDGQWCCAEIWTTKPLGFGSYQCQVEGPIDVLDPNIVFSMFSYAGPDGIKETDIEFARWGNPKAHNGNWTVYPDDKSEKIGQHTFDFKLSGTYTTSRFIWSSKLMQYELLGGHQPLGSETNLMESWIYVPANSKHAITQNPVPLHFNLWLFRGRPPTDGKPVEIIVHSFKWQPSEGT